MKSSPKTIEITIKHHNSDDNVMTLHYHGGSLISHTMQHANTTYAGGTELDRITYSDGDTTEIAEIGKKLAQLLNQNRV